MARTAAIGIQDFSNMIEKNYFYVDKTNFIKEWWENGDTVTLITRPRRFGKTLTMSMTDYFFSIKHADRSDLFENLSIWKEKEYRGLQGTYPVIFLSFANVKGCDFEETKWGICREISNIFLQHTFLPESGLLAEQEKDFFARVSDSMDVLTASASLNSLSSYLYKYYSKKSIILLDEYDTPMQEAYVNGYWDELVRFTRKLFNYTFKTNPYLERGLMTGITRVSNESIFSDLNNLEVVAAASNKYETVFGFTEQEVSQALHEYDLQDKEDKVKKWYDGFRFGDCDGIYNPWSIIQFLGKKKFAAYWANSSSNAFVGKLIQKSNSKIKMDVENLIQGKSFHVELDEQIVFDQLDEDPNAVWSLLLASGYLKIINYTDSYSPEGLLKYELGLTNLEIHFEFRKMIRRWFVEYEPQYNEFVKALLSNDVKKINIFINKVTENMISFFDSGRKPSAETEPERFYHGLILGLMLDLEDRYVITSNRESGFGRYDVLLEPKNTTDDGIILEFKVNDAKEEKSLEDAVQAAIQQILDKKYAAILEQKCDRKRIRIYGFAFSGKKVLAGGGYLKEYD